MSLNYYSEMIGRTLDLDVKDSECFKTLPIDVLIKLFDVLMDKVEASEDNQVAFPPQDITIFIVQYWAGNGQWAQDYFTCPMNAARQYQYVIANIPESSACISTEKVSTVQYQPERD